MDSSSARTSKVKLSTKITMEQYLVMEDRQDRPGIARFLHERLSERYIEPLQAVPVNKKNGFSIMAIACLLVEAIGQFEEGLDETPHGHAAFFKRFFVRHTPLNCFAPVAESFYKNVRCGLLHSGETKGTWKITRAASASLLDAQDLKINANQFLKALSQILAEYETELAQLHWDHEKWAALRKKMRHVCDNA